MFSHLLGAQWRFSLVPSLDGAPFVILGSNVYIEDAGDYDTNLETARRAIRTAGSFAVVSPPAEVAPIASSNLLAG